MFKRHPRTLLASTLLPLLLSGCGGGFGGGVLSTKDSAPRGYPDVSHTPNAVPREEPYAPANLRPYTVFGQHYVPIREHRDYREQGVASWYGNKFHGNKTANGERYDMFAMTAAHKTLPLPSYVRVRNLNNGREIVVRVNDRGPFHGNRIIDLSYAAANKLGMASKGTALVEVTGIDASPKPSAKPSANPPKLAAEPVTPSSQSITDTPDPIARNPRIYLQVGAFGDASNAKRLQSSLEAQLKRAVRIDTEMVDQRIMHRVQIGPLPSVEVADQVVDRLEDMKIHQTKMLLR